MSEETINENMDGDNTKNMDAKCLNKIAKRNKWRRTI